MKLKKFLKLNIHEFILKLKKLFSLGFLGSIKCILEKRKLKALQKKFNFMNWHAEGCFECRPYKRQILEIINNISPESLVDIGCGLAEILSKSNAKYKYGIDPDLSVIRAAKYLNPKIKFFKGNSDFLFKMIKDKKINIKSESLLIASGWTHNINKNELEIFLKKSLNYFNYIIIDIFNIEQIKRINILREKDDLIENFTHTFLLDTFDVEIIPFIDNNNQSIVLIKK